MPLWRSAPPQSTRSLVPDASSLHGQVEGGERGRRRPRRPCSSTPPRSSRLAMRPGDHVREHAGERVLGRARAGPRRAPAASPRRSCGQSARKPYAPARSVPASAPKITDVALAVEVAVGVAGVGEGAAARPRARGAAPARSRRATRRDAVRERVERDVGRGSRPTSTASSPAVRRGRGRSRRRGSQRSRGTSVIAFDAADDVRPERVEVAARPGRSRPCRRSRRPAAGRSARRPALGRARPPRSDAAPPSLTSRCSSAIGRDVVAQRGDLADHEHALALLRRRRRPSTSSPLSPRRRPLTAIRSRPRLSCSSAAQISSAGSAVGRRAARVSATNART